MLDISFSIALFAMTSLVGARSYNKTCIAKIMKLENSKLKESVVKLMERRYHHVVT